MKNRITLLLVVIFVLGAGLGCRWLNPFSGTSSGTSSERGTRTVTDTAVVTTVGEELIGIEECDAIVTELTTPTHNPDEGYIVKAFRQYYVNMIRESIRKSIEENKSDPEKLRGECVKIKAQLDKYRAEEESKK
ncbi:MAG: hypothetical protein H0V76_08640 [Blastocatellia bacterium]|nr:hypothetical protein [Blastocatellia bacterium]